MVKNNAFQEGINTFLDRKKLSQRKLAEIIDCSNMTISLWCLGKHEPKVSDVHKLIKEGITASELFGSEIARILIKNTNTQEVELDDETILEIKKKAMEGAYRELFKQKLLK